MTIKMASSDVTIAQDGGQGSVKAHPYLVALVRWCVSCLWSTATVLLHRLLAGYTIRPSITASKPPTKPRAAGTDHLHPEPKVECQVLHQPQKHSFDVIFVHGLYGSLGNTWRQGDWRSNKPEPNKVPLLRPSSCTCLNEGKDTCPNEGRNTCSNEGKITCSNDGKNSKTVIYDDLNEVSFNNIDGKFYNEMKSIPKDEMFITEKFFDHTVLDQVEILDNYETQAQFVRDLFEKENRMCSDVNEGDDGKVEVNINEVNCECRINEGRKCEVGCGCVCDECYSTCWPRDWIRVDYPEARVISVNYTSDPYLWRPLWVKECKRLRLHERAEQMMKQLIDLGVGERPIIWVGHSKGGLFIKHIYCEAYEAHLKITQDQTELHQGPNQNENTSRKSIPIENNNVDNSNNTVSNKLNVNDINCDMYFNENMKMVNDNDAEINENVNESNMRVEIDESGDKGEMEEMSSNSEEDRSHLHAYASLWTQSAGFMFYSVPHRGSPLAGIKTPLTARSIELLEINKDCSLVLSLQDRWLKATESSRPQVRSLVETCRTLMSVLWLRIVSVPSADAGIGALYGVSVDHREICKPSSRHCLLYEELMSLMRAALNQCKCDS